MNFDPIHFYLQAGRWYREPPENDQAHWRSIVSRGYYAAFLFARNEAGISTTGANVHELTANFYLKNRKSGVGNRLNDLRLRRNKADYQSDEVCTQRVAGETLKYSLEILKGLGAVLPG